MSQERNVLEKYRDTRVLITGGAGFVGSHLADSLVEYVEKLVLLDNLSTGTMDNINHLIKKYPNKVEFVKGDLRDLETCIKVTQDIDVVFHLGAQINPVKAVEDPFYDFDVNARGTLNILEASRLNNVPKLVYASTNVYGNPKYLPFDENHPIDLLSPYAASKLSGEAYAIVYNNTYGVKTVRLRFTNIYGPRQTTKSESGVIAIFIERVLDNKPPIIFGDGKQTRDFVYVTDVVNALLRAGIVKEAEGEVFNIGSGKETTILELAYMIIRLAGKDLKPVFGPPRAADFRRAQADISKARRILGYEPQVELEEGLRRTIEWWRQFKQ